MEEDIQNYSPTVMFNGTPCMLPKIRRDRFLFNQRFFLDPGKAVYRRVFLVPVPSKVGTRTGAGTRNQAGFKRGVPGSAGNLWVNKIQ